MELTGHFAQSVMVQQHFPALEEVTIMEEDAQHVEEYIKLMLIQEECHIIQ